MSLRLFTLCTLCCCPQIAGGLQLAGLSGATSATGATLLAFIVIQNVITSLAPWSATFSRENLMVSNRRGGGGLFACSCAGGTVLVSSVRFVFGHATTNATLICMVCLQDVAKRPAGPPTGQPRNALGWFGISEFGAFSKVGQEFR
jgi:hypothetical protein